MGRHGERADEYCGTASDQAAAKSYLTALPTRPNTVTGTLKVPSAFIELTASPAIDPLTGELTQNFLERMSMTGQQKSQIHNLISSYAQKFTLLEAQNAEVVEDDDGSYLLLKPIAEELDEATRQLREDTVAQLGSEKGLLASASILKSFRAGGHEPLQISFHVLADGSHHLTLDREGATTQDLIPGESIDFSTWHRWAHLNDVVEKYVRGR